jgi:hypothetical protein
MVAFRSVVLLWLSLYSARALSDTLTISPGDQITVQISTDLDAQVSRRGVVDLVNEGHGTWLVRGLRAGVVVIRWISEAGDLVADKMVEVINPATMDSFPVWTCSLRGVTCDRERRLVQGVFSDGGQWLQAKAWCQRYHDCWFEGEVAQAAQQHVRDKLGVLFPSAGSWQIEGSRLIFVGRCDEEFLKRLKVQMAATAPALDAVRCSMHGSQRFRLRLKLVVMNRSTASKLGLDVQAGTLLPRPQAAWHVIAHSMQAGSEVKLVGEPTLIVERGASGKMTSGGEFKVFYDSSGEEGSIKEGWKAYGLRFEVKPATAHLEDQNIIISLSLSAREAGAGDALGTYAVESRIPLIDSGRFLLSVASVARAGFVDQSTFSLAGIPILGPLFKVINRDESQQLLSVWAFVDEEPASVGNRF